MLKVVIGHSEDPDSICAVEEVLQQCEQDLMDMAPSAGILFAAIDFDHAVILEEISRVFPLFGTYLWILYLWRIGTLRNARCNLFPPRNFYNSTFGDSVEIWI